jgi:type 1 glutamine amidotransferase
MARRRGFFFRAFRALLLLALIFAAVSLVFIWKSGAWNKVFPSSHHDTVAPHLPTELASPSVLVFSKTNGFRHIEGIAGGAQALLSITQRNGWDMFHTENGAVFNEQDLARFDAVVFLSVSGDVLSAAQEQAFQNWLEAGGGWLGIHAAGDDSHAGWPWYIDNLIGAEFTAHIMGPQFQRATVVLENHQHRALQGLPNIWVHEEEWYSWAQSPRASGFTILATIDEDSYTPVQKVLGREVDLSMVDHPVVWANCVGSGRSIYATMGHKAAAFEQPRFRKLIENSLSWLTDKSASGC